MALFDIHNAVKGTKSSPVDADYLAGYDSAARAGKKFLISDLSTKFEADIDARNPGDDVVTTKISTGTAPADLEIDCGTEKTLILTESVWEDLRVPVTSTRKGGSKDPDFAILEDDAGGTSQGVFCEWFNKNGEEELYFSVQMPHSYKLGTDIEPHIHWTPAANGVSGRTVSWGLEYTLAAIGGTFGDTTIVYSVTHLPADAVLVAKKHYLQDFAAIDMSTISTVSAMLVCRLFRDATGAGGTDDYDDDAGLLEFDFHYEIDTMGSRTEHVK